jgi:hypothetical protein
MYDAYEIAFQPKMSYKIEKKLFEVCQKQEGISVARHVCEILDAVSHWLNLANSPRKTGATSNVDILLLINPN